MKTVRSWILFVVGVIIMAFGLREIIQYSQQSEALIDSQRMLISLLEEKDSGMEEILRVKEEVRSIDGEIGDRLPKGIVLLIAGGLIASYPSIKVKKSEQVAGSDVDG